MPFADATAGEETYGAGRYLLDTVKGADLGTRDGRLVLDFNFAYNPSCSYDPRWAARSRRRQPARDPGADGRAARRRVSRRLDRAAPGERPAERDLVGVLEVAADGQAGGQARYGDVGRARAQAAAMWSAVASPVVVGLVASTTSRTSPPSTRGYSSAILRSSGSTPSIGDRAPPSTW